MARANKHCSEYSFVKKIICGYILLSYFFMFAPAILLAAEMSCFLTANGTSIVNQEGSVVKKKAALRRHNKILTKNRKRLKVVRQNIRRTKKSNLSRKRKQRKLSKLTKRKKALRSNISTAKSKLAGIRKCAKSSLSNLTAGIPSIIEATEFIVLETETTKVPDDLTIRSSGPITIAGVLKADSEANKADGSGQSILLKADGDINISGQVVAGNGKTNPSLAALKEGDAEGVDGYVGGEIEINSGGDLILGQESILQAGNGSDGSSATAVKTTSASAVEYSMNALTSGSTLTSTAGKGGGGGNITIRADGKIKITPNGSRPQIVVGNGGSGGNAKTIAEGKTPTLTERTANAGRGGDSGFPAFPSNLPGDFEGLTFDLITTTNDLKQGSEVIMPSGGQLMLLDEASSAVFGGGVGGATGVSQVGADPVETDSILMALGRFDRVIERALEVSVAPAAACPPPRKVDGQPEVDVGEDGSNGFFGPGHGGDSYALARRGRGQGKGGNATSTSGKGGDLRSILALNTDVFTDKVSIGFRVTGVTSAGRAGKAYAQAGDGGDTGGIGGDATATGGPGGNAPFWDNIIDIQLTNAIGGGGGKAEAFGGDAGDGATCCTPPTQGQSGGKGGKAIAVGGRGGSGTARNYGGSAIATGGSSGSGGDGNLPGDEGALDETTATKGQLGDGNIDPGPGSVFVPPEETETDGAEGEPGSPCPTTPTPTPSPTSTPGPTPTASSSPTSSATPGSSSKQRSFSYQCRDGGTRIFSFEVYIPENAQNPSHQFIEFEGQFCPGSGNETVVIETSPTSPEEGRMTYRIKVTVNESVAQNSSFTVQVNWS